MIPDAPNGPPPGGSSQDPPENKIDEQQMAMVYAAMMEELGIGRKNALPLQDVGPDIAPESMPTIRSKRKHSENDLVSGWRDWKPDDIDEAQFEGLDNIADGNLARIRAGGSFTGGAVRGVNFSSRGFRGNRGDRGGRRGRGDQIDPPPSGRGGRGGQGGLLNSPSSGRGGRRGRGGHLDSLSSGIGGRGGGYMGRGSSQTASFSNTVFVSDQRRYSREVGIQARIDKAIARLRAAPETQAPSTSNRPQPSAAPRPPLTSINTQQDAIPQPPVFLNPEAFLRANKIVPQPTVVVPAATTPLPPTKSENIRSNLQSAGLAPPSGVQQEASAAANKLVPIQLLPDVKNDQEIAVPVNGPISVPPPVRRQAGLASSRWATPAPAIASLNRSISTQPVITTSTQTQPELPTSQHAVASQATSSRNEPVSPQVAPSTNETAPLPIAAPRNEPAPVHTVASSNEPAPLQSAPSGNEPAPAKPVLDQADPASIANRPVIIREHNTYIQKINQNALFGKARLLKDFLHDKFLTLELEQRNEIVAREIVNHNTTLSVEDKTIMFKAENGVQWEFFFQLPYMANGFRRTVEMNNSGYPTTRPQSRDQTPAASQATNDEETTDNAPVSGRDLIAVEVARLSLSEHLEHNVSVTSDDSLFEIHNSQSSIQQALSEFAEQGSQVPHRMSADVYGDMAEVDGVEPLIGIHDTEVEKPVKREQAVHILLGLADDETVAHTFQHLSESSPGGLLSHLSNAVMKQGGPKASVLSNTELLTSDMYAQAISLIVGNFLSRSEVFNSMPDYLSVPYVQKISQMILVMAIASRVDPLAAQSQPQAMATFVSETATPSKAELKSAPNDFDDRVNTYLSKPLADKRTSIEKSSYVSYTAAELKDLRSNAAEFRTENLGAEVAHLAKNFKPEVKLSQGFALNPTRGVVNSSPKPVKVGPSPDKDEIRKGPRSVNLESGVISEHLSPQTIFAAPIGSPGSIGDVSMSISSEVTLSQHLTDTPSPREQSQQSQPIRPSHSSMSLSQMHIYTPRAQKMQDNIFANLRTGIGLLNASSPLASASQARSPGIESRFDPTTMLPAGNDLSKHPAVENPTISAPASEPPPPEPTKQDVTQVANISEAKITPPSSTSKNSDEMQSNSMKPVATAPVFTPSLKDNVPPLKASKISNSSLSHARTSSKIENKDLGRMPGLSSSRWAQPNAQSLPPFPQQTSRRDPMPIPQSIGQFTPVTYGYQQRPVNFSNFAPAAPPLVPGGTTPVMRTVVIKDPQSGAIFECQRSMKVGSIPIVDNTLQTVIIQDPQTGSFHEVTGQVKAGSVPIVEYLPLPGVAPSSGYEPALSRQYSPQASFSSSLEMNPSQQSGGTAPANTGTRVPLSPVRQGDNVQAKLQARLHRSLKERTSPEHK